MRSRWILIGYQHSQQPAASSQQVAKQIIILGPDHNGTFQAKELIAFADAHTSDVILIGDGLREVTLDEIKTIVAGKIDSSTRVDICAHGGNIGDVHHVWLTGTTGIKTEDVFKALADGVTAPMQIHMASCYGGCASKYVKVLPRGSIVLGHCSSTQPKRPLRLSWALDPIQTQYAHPTSNPLTLIHWMKEIANDTIIAVLLLDGTVASFTLNPFWETVQDVEKLQKYCQDIHTQIAKTETACRALNIWPRHLDVVASSLITSSQEEIAKTQETYCKYMFFGGWFDEFKQHIQKKTAKQKAKTLKMERKPLIIPH